MKNCTERPRKTLINYFYTGFVILAIGAPYLHSQNHAQDLATKDIVGPFVAEALQSSPALKAADKRYLAAKQTIVSAGILPNPKIQITHFVESIQTRTGPQRQALTLQQPVPWLGERDSKRDAARSKSDALWHAYVAQQFTLIEKVSRQVLEVAFLDKAIGITNENIGLIRRLETIVEDKIKAGGNLSDLLKLQVEVQRFEDLAAKQETMRTVAAATLQSLLGRRSATLLPTFNWDVPDRIQGNSQQWLQAIPERSPELAILRSLENSQAARQRIARFASKPEFSVGLNYIRTGEALGTDTLGSGKDPWALMVGVSLPIWGKANNAIAMEASLQTEAVRAQIKDLELKLLAEGSGWIAKLEDAQNRIQRYQTKLLPLARQSQEIMESAYQAGNASILDLIDSERQLLNLETEYWRSAADGWRARWKLAIISGGLWLN
ncbi:TolC family protein [Puniceicoccaceae bacterium K14]|nr:TolC family protein [Puniceicoccaceae bacterium K14]